MLMVCLCRHVGINPPLCQLTSGHSPSPSPWATEKEGQDGWNPEHLDSRSHIKTLILRLRRSFRTSSLPLPVWPRVAVTSGLFVFLHRDLSFPAGPAGRPLPRVLGRASVQLRLWERGNPGSCPTRRANISNSSLLVLILDPESKYNPVSSARRISDGGNVSVNLHKYLTLKATTNLSPV